MSSCTVSDRRVNSTAAPVSHSHYMQHARPLRAQSTTHSGGERMNAPVSVGQQLVNALRNTYISSPAPTAAASRQASRNSE
ncbi:hypothetical protein EB796_009247 [Bugula neritina]|uniref:Uncharacterized protein n=1 Tax=Bugula neritina TaxID=10212 RepID=A0A7J7K2L7_BUGNE|nr:hypothetical protein EB796_009247 [Bugula neritina]